MAGLTVHGIANGGSGVMVEKGGKENGGSFQWWNESWAPGEWWWFLAYCVIIFLFLSPFFFGLICAVYLRLSLDCGSSLDEGCM